MSSGSLRFRRVFAAAGQVAELLEKRYLLDGLTMPQLDSLWLHLTDPQRA